MPWRILGPLSKTLEPPSGPLGRFSRNLATNICFLFLSFWASGVPAGACWEPPGRLQALLGALGWLLGRPRWSWVALGWLWGRPKWPLGASGCPMAPSSSGKGVRASTKAPRPNMLSLYRLVRPRHIMRRSKSTGRKVDMQHESSDHCVSRHVSRQFPKSHGQPAETRKRPRPAWREEACLETCVA